MGYTVKEVEEKVAEYEANSHDGGAYGGNVYENVKWGEGVDVPGLGKLELVEDYGGEGMGDDYWVVFKVGDQYFRKDGYYASYDGGELDGDLYEVEPVQVTKTEYRNKVK